jgi:hypothetical protein
MKEYLVHPDRFSVPILNCTSPLTPALSLFFSFK